MATEGRILGIDYGRIRIGVAVSDSLGISARPLGFIPRHSDEQAARTIAALARQEQACCLVIGLPLHAGGEAGENVAWVRSFARILQRHCSLPLHEVDERYSSQEAEDALRVQGDWPPKNPGLIDARAAAILLRRYLDGER